MVFSRLLSIERTVGVDIGSSNIKIVAAENTKTGVRITHAAMCPTPPDSIKEGVVVDIPQMAAAVQFVMRSAGIKPAAAITAVAGTGVIVRRIQIPKMTEQTLRKSINLEAGKYISASIEDSVIEFQILGDAENGDEMNVLIIATPKTMIDSKVAVLEQAELDPLAVDIEAFSAFRSLIEYNADASLREGTLALLDMGEGHTEINLVANGNVELTRTIPIAGKSFANAIKNAENCTEEDSIQKKHSLDLGDLLNPSESSASPGLKVLQSLVDEMLREIRRSVNYYQSQLPEGSPETIVDRLVFTGGSAGLKGLLPYASSRLKVDVKMGLPVVSDSTGFWCADNNLGEDDIRLFTVAIGLAVKEMPGYAILNAA